MCFQQLLSHGKTTGDSTEISLQAFAKTKSEPFMQMYHIYCSKHQADDAGEEHPAEGASML